MNRSDTIAHLAECVCLAQSAAPLTQEELAAHRSLCAAEQARAEARRTQPPQDDLLGAA